MYSYKKEPIKSFEDYQIDTNGIVYSKKGKPLKYSLNHNGYCIINFYINKKRFGFSIHTLVAKQFIFNDNPQYKTQVNHIDGNKKNNNVTNLEWVTPTENTTHAITVLKKGRKGKNHPSAKKVQAIKKCNEKEILNFGSIADAARYFCKEGKNFRYIQNTICNVLKGKKKSYQGYYWNYIV